VQFSVCSLRDDFVDFAYDAEHHQPYFIPDFATILLFCPVLLNKIYIQSKLMDLLREDGLIAGFDGLTSEEKEIADLEKKLGISESMTSKQKLAKEFAEDGLGNNNMHNW